MSVFHLDIEAFMTAVERIKHRELIQRPLVIAPQRPRALVMAASPDAKKIGIKRGQPIPHIRKYFPGVKIIPPDVSLYERAHCYVLEIAGAYCPTVEPLGYGHIAMDMTGMRAMFGTLENAAVKLSRELHERARLKATIGIAANKLVSTIAAKEIQKEREPLYKVDPGEERPFLSPLSCKALPEWEEHAIRRLLFELNLRRIGQVQAIPREIFSFALGETGARLYRHALGIDPEPVTPSDRTQQITMDHTFFPDTNDDQVIKSKCYGLIERLCFQLRARNQVAHKAMLALKYTDDVWRQRRLRFPPTHQEQVIHHHVRDHYERLCDRRRRVRYIKITLAEVMPYHRQPTLFDAAKPDKVTTHLDHIRRRFGAPAIQYGRTLAGTGGAIEAVA